MEFHHYPLKHLLCHGRWNGVSDEKQGLGKPHPPVSEGEVEFLLLQHHLAETNKKNTPRFSFETHHSLESPTTYLFGAGYY